MDTATGTAGGTAPPASALDLLGRVGSPRPSGALPPPAFPRRREVAGAAVRGGTEARGGAGPRSRARRGHVGREAGASRRERRQAEAQRPGVWGRGRVGAHTHQIWNLSSGPVAYCIFNLLLGTPPMLAEASPRVTADAATRTSNRSLILTQTAAPAAFSLRLHLPESSHQPLSTAQARPVERPRTRRTAHAHPRRMRARWEEGRWVLVA